MAGLVEIEKVVQFAEIEEDKYTTSLEGPKKKLIKLIGKKNDNAAINAISSKDQVVESVRRTEERVVSGGQHSVTNVRATPERKSTLFFLNQKKDRIAQLFETMIFCLFQMAGVWTLNNDSGRTYFKYHQITEIMKKFDRIKVYYNRIIGGEDMQEEAIQGTSKSSVKERRKAEWKKLRHVKQRQGMNEEEADEQPARKYGKKAVEENLSQARQRHERNAKKEKNEQQKSFMEPIHINERFRIRLLYIVNSFERVILNEQLIVSRLGGKEKVEGKLKEAREEFLRPAVEKRGIAEAQLMRNFGDWEANKDQHIGIVKLFEVITNKIKGAAKTFIDKAKWERCEPVLRNMPFWPVFTNSTQHFEDGKIEQANEYHKVHQEQHNEDCMGLCNKKSIGQISQSYKKSTTSQVFQKMIEFINGLDALRQELFDDCSKMINFHNNIDLSKPFDLQKDVLTVLNCGHKLWKTATISINNANRKMEKEKLKCCVCQVSHTLAHLRFSIGIGSFHGEVRTGAKKPIDDFVKMMLKFGPIREKTVDGAEQLKEFTSYMDRLRQTILEIQSSCELFNTFDNKLLILFKSVRKIGINQLRFREKLQNLTDGQVKEHCLKKYGGQFYSTEKKLEKELKPFRYLLNVYKVEKKCVICLVELEVVVNTPCWHTMCKTCVEEVRRRSENDESLDCPVCREKFNYKDVVITRKESTTFNMELPVKLQETVRLMKEIIEDDENKILLVTSAEYGKSMYNYLMAVLEKAEMPFAAVTRTRKNSKVSTWEFQAGCKILLCSPSTCSNDFDVAQANHIIFLEQSLSFTPLGKAIVDNQQQRDIKLYHMLVGGSVDMVLREIAKNARNGNGEDRNGIELTVAEIRQIFRIPR